MTPGFPKQAGETHSRLATGLILDHCRRPALAARVLTILFYSRLFRRKNSFDMFKGERDGKPFKRELRPTACRTRGLCQGLGRSVPLGLRWLSPRGSRDGRTAAGDLPPAGKGTPGAPGPPSHSA